MAKFEASTPGPIRARLQEFSDQVGIWVTDMGAAGNGITDDTAAFNAAIVAANGKVPVLVPAATYMINAATSILFNVAGTRMVMAPGAVLKVITNALGSYVCVLVSAADCSIEGGTIMGDVTTHTGGTGEWGHGLSITAGGDRFRAVRVTAKNCWGDGFYVALGPVDVSLIDCTADANRRQGASIVGATRCRIIGGSYINTGTIAVTAPGAGICIEPNPSSGVNVLDCIVSGVVCASNVGMGISIVQATGQTTTATVSDSICRYNSVGIVAAGTGGSMAADLIGNVCTGNSSHGIYVYNANGSVNIVGGNCYSNGEYGLGATSKVTVSGLTSTYNVKGGVNLNTGADGSTIRASVMRSNATASVGIYNELDIAATGCVIQGCVMIPATSGNRAAYGVMLRSGATGAVILASRATAGSSGVSSITPTDLVQLPNVGATVTTVNAACTDLATSIALLNQVRTLLISNAGLAK